MNCSCSFQDIVPARIVLLVTLCLVLINMFNSTTWVRPLDGIFSSYFFALTNMIHQLRKDSHQYQVPKLIVLQNKFSAIQTLIKSESRKTRPPKSLKWSHTSTTWTRKLKLSQIVEYALLQLRTTNIFTDIWLFKSISLSLWQTKND